MIVDLGKTEAVLSKEQAPGENYRPTERVRVYLIDVEKDLKGPQHNTFKDASRDGCKALELEVP